MKKNDSFPFSESPIWQLQKEYFEQAGIDAWKQGEVPHYVTSNPFIANAYAEMVYGFLCDLANTGRSSETVYILELGAGHGRFYYHFLKHLEPLTSSNPNLPPFCYVLSDFSENIFPAWKEHPRLQRFLEKGQLDYCCFNALEEKDIYLQVAQKYIGPGSLMQPLVVIANYFFDTIPQELFVVDGQELFQCFVKLNVPKNVSAKEKIRDLTIREESFVLQQMPFYTEDFLNVLLQQFIDLLHTKTFLVFPHKGLQCMQYLSSFSKEGMMLLSADRGHHRIDEIEGQLFPSMSRHGSFSYPVNYHALKTWCTNRNGIALFPGHTHQSIVTGCLLALAAPQKFIQTQLAYRRFIYDFTPDDFYTLKQKFTAHSGQYGIHEIIACIRLSKFDAHLFSQLLPRITSLINQQQASEPERWDLFLLVHKVWDMYFPLGEEENLAFNLGVLLYNLQFAQEALTYFNLSKKLYGSTPNLTYNMALCYYDMNEHGKALQMARETLSQDPVHKKNTELLQFLTEA